MMNIVHDDVHDDGDELDISPELLNSFQEDLRRYGIEIFFVAGAWSPEFVDLVLPNRDVFDDGSNSKNQRPLQLLIMASETIYSPSSLRAFSETLLSLLQRSTPAPPNSDKFVPNALVAAKKVYFGVGGGVDEFLGVLEDVARENHVATVIKEVVDTQDKGVGRVILAIGLNQE